jgi:hypothetical protein
MSETTDRKVAVDSKKREEEEPKEFDSHLSTVKMKTAVRGKVPTLVQSGRDSTATEKTKEQRRPQGEQRTTKKGQGKLKIEGR